MDGKKRAFPRFYFVSTNDLLDILSNGNSPHVIMKHMCKVLLAVEELVLQDSKAGDRPEAVSMVTCVGKEKFDFLPLPFKLQGKVEVYL